MTTTSLDDRITFAVHDVEPASEKLPLCNASDALERLLQASGKEFAGRLSVETIGKILYCSNKNTDTVSNVCINPFFAAVHLAFSQHRPLVLSPDMIWTLILQGLGQHIKNNAEELRDKVVSHKGKATIEILCDKLEISEAGDWESIVEGFSARLSEAVTGSFEKLISNFSTTGRIERTVSQIALMDMFQPYFNYHVFCICGIPSISLEGKKQDWSLLCQKAELLSQYELDWWLKDLRIILKEFERAAAGIVDRQFWRNIYKQEQRYGTDSLNGWIIRLVPYLRDAHGRCFDKRNRLIGSEFLDLPLNEDKSDSSNFAGPDDLRSEQLPLGLSMVPVELTPLKGCPKELKFYGGFIGIDQDENGLALRPRLGWAVGEFGERKTTRLPYDGRAVIAKSADQYEDWLNKLIEHEGVSGLPADLFQFYKEFDGVEFPISSFMRCFLSISETELIDELCVCKSCDDAFEADTELEKIASLPIGGPWLKFAEFIDGSFLAIELKDSRDKPTDPRLYRVCRVNPLNLKAYLFAASFTDLLDLTHETRGKMHLDEAKFKALVRDRIYSQFREPP